VKNALHGFIVGNTYRKVKKEFSHLKGRQDRILPYVRVAENVGRDSNPDEWNGQQDRILPYVRVAGNVSRDSNPDERAAG